MDSTHAMVDTQHDTEALYRADADQLWRRPAAWSARIPKIRADKWGENGLNLRWWHP